MWCNTIQFSSVEIATSDKFCWRICPSTIDEPGVANSLSLLNCSLVVYKPCLDQRILIGWILWLLVLSLLWVSFGHPAVSRVFWGGAGKKKVFTVFPFGQCFLRIANGEFLALMKVEHNIKDRRSKNTTLAALKSWDIFIFFLHWVSLSCNFVG